MRKTMAALAIAFAGNVGAIIPDSGWYFNPNEPGRGFNVEIQNSTVFMSGFIYDDFGQQIWVVSGGPMSSDRAYLGDAFLTTDGQPIGGAYRPPTNIPFGKAQITWSDTKTATIVVNGRTFHVTRQLFGVDFTSTTQPLLGELTFVEGTSPFFSERVVLSSTQVINGETWAVGHGTGTSRIVIGQYSAQLGKWGILFDSSDPYYNLYTFTFEGVNYVEGSNYIYLKGASPSGSLPMLGHRTKSAQKAAGQNAPGSEKSLAIDDGQARTKAAIQGEATMSPEHLDFLHKMEEVMRSLK
jgi:hypothetical protein